MKRREITLFYVLFAGQSVLFIQTNVLVLYHQLYYTNVLYNRLSLNPHHLSHWCRPCAF